MSDPTSVLLDTIAQLDDSSVAEATQLLAGALGVEKPSELLDPDLIEHPMRHRADVVDLGRLTLMVAATDPESRALVSESIAGAGRKNFIFGGVEVVLIAGLAISALHICVTKGKTGEERHVTIEERADGATVTTIDSKVSYGVSARLATMIASAIKNIGGAS